ncbi:TRAP transporter large permease [Limnohabitans sp. 2KL-51]|jgi:tripartite ATP-independent transporter DctM subunit|uniref:TRAP transporter large permease n=1 Tax=Limnohabitans sp. 2KL-51 TaxID=1977911 RepID=UPI000D388453|nr:TRAP transporter large permease [Limnohabitans sp. 2KL-51]PUE47719.1 C4-dicarboxylate ABC transporter permease [Limnohabitans sp. 2KL-51]
MTEASIGLLAMLILAFARVPLAIAMGLVGFAGLWWMRGLNPALASVTSTVYEAGFEYTLSVVPLFILMGNFVTRAGMSRELYRAAYTLVGHFRGGLAMATVMACAGFGSVCGSSIATAATMTKVAYPSMKGHGYSGQLAAGAIAAGGTLGILIPPSTILVIYGLVTETSIGKLFAAGMVPGLLAVFMMCLTISYITWRDPSSGPAAERSGWAERFDAMKDVWAVAVLFVIVMGGIYGGVFTTTEGAGIGAFGAFIIALLRKSLNVSVTLDILIESARTTGMLFMILVGALVFANFVNFTTLPSDLKSLVSTHNISPVAVMIAICAIYIVLGAAMEELSMVLLTLPVFFPLVVSLGFDPVWFGIVIVLVVMIGLISPPVGMNMFVVRNMLPELSTATIFKGVMPFVYTLVVVLALLVAFPQIALFLPQALKL